MKTTEEVVAKIQEVKDRGMVPFVMVLPIAPEIAEGHEKELDKAIREGAQQGLERHLARWL